MPSGPNLAETPRFARIRKFTETFIYVLLLFVVYPITINNDEIIFQKYLQDFNKSYENETVYQKKFEAFKKSLNNIELLNANKSNGSATYGLTKYSDMLPDEFLQSHLLFKVADKKSNEFNIKNERTKRSISKFRYKVPDKIDLREKNVVTEIQAQGPCGACWAFAVIGMIESMSALKTGNLTRLSVQQMIDCSSFTKGCAGGDICSLLEWLTTFNVKISSEQNYPLSLSTEKCKNINSSITVQVEKYQCLSFINEEDLMLYLLANHGPLTVGINAESWQHYIGGIIRYHCNSNFSSLNHAVQIVGYDLTSPIPHYIVRNSWGKDFGDDGYLYIEIGNNLCGLAHEVAAVKIL